VDERTRHIRSLVGAGKSQAAGGTVKAPMPGLVVRVLVQPGQTVAVGTALVVLEAMKMENELKAPVAGVVARVSATPGQAVEKGEILVTLAPG
jgi:pyruvate carboxylase subunit B